jgi:1-deoxy-D-xylulose-5-phosphate reductoisomerase
VTTESLSVVRKRVVIFGATGSVGRNTLDVIDQRPELFDVFALTAHSSVDQMLALCARYRPIYAVMSSSVAGALLLQKCRAEKLPTIVLSGSDALVTIAQHPDVDIVMAAIVGAAGLGPCIAAAMSGKRLLLANKEALVVGGQFFMNSVAQGGATLLPIDSEHSAIFQCLPERRQDWYASVKRLILTASGGPFRTRDPATFSSVTLAEACAHPNWVMGRKISVDSATMMNKALEVIEAKYLFNINQNKIETLIHPQSVIHSMVEFTDFSVLAQLGTPDMRVPIAYGLHWPTRGSSGGESLDFFRLNGLTFESLTSIDHQRRFPCLGLAAEALKVGGEACIALNAANEVAVDAFIRGDLCFDQIFSLNASILGLACSVEHESLEGLIQADIKYRRLAQEALRRF